MSIPAADGRPGAAPPGGDSRARAAAMETIWRLAAAAFCHPTPEQQQALASGRFTAALSAAWQAVTGRPWPETPPSPDFAALEAGFIATFLHGRAGKPVASLLAGDHETLLAGLSRPVFMLNVAAFYRHFGLQAATADEGRTDEPDHLAAMLEFMTVLAHLEAGALGRGRDPSPYRRAQRDFLRRYLLPLLRCIGARVRPLPADALDPTLRRLVDHLPDWAEGLAIELESRVGRYRDPDTPATAAAGTAADGGPAAAAGTTVVEQNLWG